jgi:hypothetical protein
MEDGQHVGEQRAIATCSNANAAPIDEPNLDGRIVRPGRAINDGNGKEGRGGDWLIRCWLATTIAFGDGPSPGVEGMFAQAMKMTIFADTQSARTLLIEVATPTLLTLDADFSRHRGLHKGNPPD